TSQSLLSVLNECPAKARACLLALPWLLALTAYRDGAVSFCAVRSKSQVAAASSVAVRRGDAALAPSLLIMPALEHKPMKNNEIRLIECPRKRCAAWYRGAAAIVQETFAKSREFLRLITLLPCARGPQCKLRYAPPGRRLRCRDSGSHHRLKSTTMTPGGSGMTATLIGRAVSNGGPWMATLRSMMPSS